MLPVAWVLQRTAKGAGTHVLPRSFAWLVRHGPAADGPVVAVVGAQLRAFLHTATPVEARDGALGDCLSPGLRSILYGRHWIVRQKLLLRLACLGFLPKSWSLIRDLLPQKKGRAMQKAHELVCWWQVGARVVRRRELASADAMCELCGCRGQAECCRAPLPAL